MDQWCMASLKRMGNLSSAFKKADIQWEQILESRHSRTKAILNNQQPWIQQKIRGPQKIQQKLENSPFPRREWRWRYQ
jgi:hypothetical protein